MARGHGVGLFALGGAYWPLAPCGPERVLVVSTGGRGSGTRGVAGVNCALWRVQRPTSSESARPRVPCRRAPGPVPPGGGMGREARYQHPPLPSCDIPLFLYGALDSHPFFPSHVASGRCFLSAAAAGALAGVVSAFAEPSSWCVGAVLNVAGAVCASAAPSSWRIGGCAGCCRGCLMSTHLCPQAVHSLPCCVSVCVRPRCPVPPRTVPAVHHMSFSHSRLVCP